MYKIFFTSYFNLSLEGKFNLLKFNFIEIYIAVSRRYFNFQDPKPNPSNECFLYFPSLHQFLNE